MYTNKMVRFNESKWLNVRSTTGAARADERGVFRPEREKTRNSYVLEMSFFISAITAAYHNIIIIIILSSSTMDRL